MNKKELLKSYLFMLFFGWLICPIVSIMKIIELKKGEKNVSQEKENDAI